LLATPPEVVVHADALPPMNPPDSGGSRFVPRKGMLGEDHLGGPVTTAEIGRGEPLGALRATLSDFLGPLGICLL